MRIVGRVMAASCAVAALSGCAATHPTVYPNEQYQKAGAAQVDEDIAECEARAKEYVKTGGQGGQMAAETARNVGVGTAIGAGSGAVGGAIYGNAGEGAAIGAASGATAGVLGTLFGWMGRKSEPDPVYRNFVDQCLRDKGYDPIGWS